MDMARLFNPEAGTDLNVCDDCGYTEGVVDGGTGLPRDVFMNDYEEAYCEICLDKKGLVQCDECLGFEPANDIKQDEHGYPTCSDCLD